MSCRQCQGIEVLFDDKLANRELSDYRAHGPGKTTQWLIDQLKSRGVDGATLLDIGGGVGAIQHAMLAAGARRAIGVDASQAYLTVARSEAARRGWQEQVEYHHGDFVELAGQVPEADIVTLDRVLCCYDDLHGLVRNSAGKARRYYGVVYPRDTWWLRLFSRLFNRVYGLMRRSYRMYIHATQEVENLLAEAGLRKEFERRTFIWQVVLFRKAS